MERFLSPTVIQDKCGDGIATEVLGCLSGHGIHVESPISSPMTSQHVCLEKTMVVAREKIQIDFLGRDIPYLP